MQGGPSSSHASRTVNEERVGLLRQEGEGAAEVTPVELLFDLVYVLAITQLTYHLLDHLSPRGAGETLLLLLAVWATWIHTAWTTNYFDRSTRAIRLVLMAAMLASLIMSASLPEAFADRGFTFGAAMVAIMVGGTLLLLTAIGRHHHLSAVFERVLIWWTAIGVLWLAGGRAHGDIRTAIWLVAVVSVYVVMWLGFPVPRLGRSRTTDYTISGEHMAERCRLFVILALGESILVTGANFGELPHSAGTTAAFVVAFVGTATLWWIYFDRAEEAGRRVIAAATDPGRLGLSAYTYFHIPIVAGIIVVAAADARTIGQPGDEATVATTALILGGPLLYLVGNALFKWAIWDYVPRSRLIAIAVLAALTPLALVASALMLMAAATLVLVGVVLRDLRVERAKLTSAEVPAP